MRTEGGGEGGSDMEQHRVRSDETYCLIKAARREGEWPRLVFQSLKFMLGAGKRYPVYVPKVELYCNAILR